MKLQPTPIKGLYVAETSAFQDARGGFARLFCARDLEEAFQGRQIVQSNHSMTAQQGALRGLHFQHPPHAEMKMVRCIKGRVWDIAVDLRRGSDTFLQHFAMELTPENAAMMVIPEGCAHGFQTLEPDSHMLYLHTAFYAPESEGGLRHDDPRLGIRWPLPVTDISARDQAHPYLLPDFEGLSL